MTKPDARDSARSPQGSPTEEQALPTEETACPPGHAQPQPGQEPPERETLGMDEIPGGLDSTVQLATLQFELEQAQKRALLAQAELENFRKRTRRDMEEERRFAQLPLIQDLLGVLDNLGLAIAAAENNQEASGLLQGVKMVAGLLEAVLQKYQCRPIPAVGHDFDPHRHEAIGQEPSPELPAGKVSRVVRTGYEMHERVIRPAQVFVSQGAGSP